MRSGESFPEGFPASVILEIPFYQTAE